jgi:hypothetical protein
VRRLGSGTLGEKLHIQVFVSKREHHHVGWKEATGHIFQDDLFV